MKDDKIGFGIGILFIICMVTMFVLGKYAEFMEGREKRLINLNNYKRPIGKEDE